MVDYRQTALGSSLATAGTALGALTLALSARAVLPGALLVAVATLSGVIALLALRDAARVHQGRVRETLVTSQTAAFLGIVLLLAPFLLDPAGVAARPLLMTLFLVAGLLVASWASYTGWCSVAAAVPVPWLSGAESGASPAPQRARAPGRAAR